MRKVFLKHLDGQLAKVGILLEQVRIEVVLGHIAVPLVELLVETPHRVVHLAHLQRIQHTQVTHLLQRIILHNLLRFLVVVGFDAACEVNIAGVQLRHQLDHLGSHLLGETLVFLAIGGIGEECRHQSIVAGG